MANINIHANVMVATPSYNGAVAAECAGAMQLASMQCLTKGVLLEWVFANGFSLIQHGRNWLNAEFLARKEFTHLLWLDDDIAFSPDAILRMVNADKDAIAGVYTTKHPTTPLFPYESLAPVVNGLQQARKVPGGFLLLKRNVVEMVSSHCEKYMLEHSGEVRESPFLFDVVLIESTDYPGQKSLLGEDFVLCHRILELGFKIHVLTDISFTHFGRHAWRGNLATTLAEEAARGFTGQGSPDAHQKNQALHRVAVGEPQPAAWL